MALYKFRVRSEEDDTFYFDVEIQSNQTFENLHNCILQTLKFDNSQLASFYISDDRWVKGKEITLLDMNENEEEKIPVMSESVLCKFIENPHQKLIYVYDFMDMWTFQLELMKILPKEEPHTSYPRVVKIQGTPPLQYGGVQARPTMLTEEDEDLISDDDADFDPEDFMDEGFSEFSGDDERQ